MIGVGRGQVYKLPEREMLVTDFLVWIDNLHAENGRVLETVSVAWDTAVIGIHVGSCRFLEPADDDGIIMQVAIGNRVCEVPKNMGFLYSAIGRSWKILNNYSAATARMHCGPDDSMHNIAKKFTKLISTQDWRR